MRPDRAYIQLQSGRKLDLLDPSRLPGPTPTWRWAFRAPTVGVATRFGSCRCPSPTRLDASADLTVAIEREQWLAELGAAFQCLPPGTRARCPYLLTGNSLTDVWVVVETDDIQQQTIAGVVVGGERDEDSKWDLGGEFTVFTDEEQMIEVQGWGCTVEIL